MEAMSETAPIPNYCVSHLRQSEETKELVAAFTEAQTKFTALKKDRAVEVQTRGGGKYSFGYATFDELVDMIRSAFKENGLSFMQPITTDASGNLILVTRLQHKSGQWQESHIPLPKIGNEYQAFGSAVTYLKRYTLTAVMGASTEEDDDANKAQGNKFTKREDRSPPKPHDAEESYPYLCPPDGPIDVIRAEGGKPAHEVWLIEVQNVLAGAGVTHLPMVKGWWAKQEPHLKKLAEKRPETAKLADATYKARVKVLEAEVAEKEPA
jgi:hypothetical protein